VADFTEHGFDSQERLDGWLLQLRNAARAEIISDHEAATKIREALEAVYKRMVDRGQMLRHHPSVQRFTLERVRPALRGELDRRIVTAANLIRMNRNQAIEKTLQRFSGWATSIPIGGSGAVDRVPVKKEMRQSLAALSFIERRVATDQSHKLAANLSEILAVDGGALAGRWHRHYTRYPREEHKQRDGRVYAVRGNWALARGLMNSGPNGYTDEITKPGEEVDCHCTYEWFHSLRALPSEMLTERGRDELERVKRAA
jgi:hypothetical protein